MASALVFAQAAVTETTDVILPFDSDSGFEYAFHARYTVDTAEKTEGSGSLKMSFTYPTGQAVNIGGMLFYNFSAPQDFSAYESFKIDIYSPTAMSGIGGIFQVNFVTGSTTQDGFNYDLDISNLVQGWNTITFEKSAYTAQVEGADWSNIDRLRLTWFNNYQIKSEYFFLDNLCASYLSGTVDPHDCVSDGTIKSDNEYHWYKCEVLGCTNQIDKETHSGGTATCNTKAYCSVCNRSYGELNPSNHAGGSEVRNGSATYSGDTYCLGCGVMTAQGYSTVSTDTSVGHTPYGVGKDLMINNADSTNGWESGLYSATVSAGTQIAEGSGSVMMSATVPKGQGASVGAMTALNFPATDFTPYLKLQIKMYLSAALSGSHTIQFNFITGSGGDGYNFDYVVTDLAAGWHTITVDRIAISKVATADWSSINRIRFTWFNYSQISTKVKFTFDEIMALASGAHVPYAVGNDLMINDCDSTAGWQVGMYHTTITAGAQIVQGSGSVTMGCVYPYGQAGNVGSMTRLFFTPTDLTPYNSIQFKVFIDADLPGLHQFQANFITGDGEDGFNQTYTFKDFESGWHTFTFDKHSLEHEVDTADWSSINAIRFTWFNLEPITDIVNFTLDSIMALSEEHICTPDILAFDEENHWYSCATKGCAEAVNEKPHYGGENTCVGVAVCEGCGYEYGEIDPENHVNTVLQNESESYTGDLYCCDCETVVKQGVEITSPEVTATVATIESSIKAGDEIIIPVTITEYANAYAYITVSVPEYDANLLEFNGFEASETDFTEALTDSGSNGFALIAVPSNDTSAAKLTGGEVCVMKFTALEDINQDVAVSVTVKANGYAFGSEDHWTVDRPLLVETVNGGIDIPEGEIVDPIVYGDCNGDDVVETEDALMVLQGAVGKIALTAEQLIRCDVNGDGAVDVTDSLCVLQFSVGKITTFPVENK